MNAPAFPNAPFSQFVALYPQLTRAETGTAIDMLIERLDRLAGDPDLEDGGDLEPDDDDKGDVSWTEWHTRGRRKLQGEHEQVRDAGGHMVLEDEELDGDETDGNGAEDEEVAWFRVIQAGPGCVVSDPDLDDGDV